VLLLIIGWIAAPSSKPAASRASSADSTPVSTEQIMSLMQLRCVTCHSAKPTFPGLAAAPAGINLETEAGLLANPTLIKQVVDNNYMPLGNITQMTEEERAMVERWTGK